MEIRERVDPVDGSKTLIVPVSVNLDNSRLYLEPASLPKHWIYMVVFLY